jgi:hypothetical protein
MRISDHRGLAAGWASIGVSETAAAKPDCCDAAANENAPRAESLRGAPMERVKRSMVFLETRQAPRELANPGIAEEKPRNPRMCEVHLALATQLPVDNVAIFTSFSIFVTG